MTATTSSTRWRSGSLMPTRFFYAAASGVNMPIVYLGSKTGRDGIHGASMASAEFDDDSEPRNARPCRSAIPSPKSCCWKPASRSWPPIASIAIQDMGAAGLTCSAVEMGAKGDLGVDLNLDSVPTREAGHDRL